MYNQLGFDTETYRNPLFWKWFWVEFIPNVCNIDDKHPFEQNDTNYRRNPFKLHFSRML